MNLIQNVTPDPSQKTTLILPDGSSFDLELVFMPMQYAWVITKLSYQTFTVCGIRVVCSPNLLFQFSTQLPFGLACFTVDNRDPSLIQDFSSGNAKLYVLTAAEVLAYQQALRGA